MARWRDVLREQYVVVVKAITSIMTCQEVTIRTISYERKRNVIKRKGVSRRSDERDEYRNS